MLGAHNSNRDQAAKNPTWGCHTSGVLPRDNLEFHKGVLMSLELALWMSSVADCIPIVERQANHGIVTCFGMNHFVGVGQLRGELNQMREAEDLQ